MTYEDKLDNLKVSVIIPTFQGESRITKTLQSLESQTLNPDEVIVVIDGSTDGTYQLLNELQSKLNIKVVYQRNHGRAGSRNSGARLAKTELLVFIDDDMILDADCLLKHFEFHLDHSNVFISGATFEMEERDQPDYQFYRAYLSKKWINAIPINRPLLKNELFMTGANMSVRKSDFESLQGFDERFRDAEDMELALRAFDNGFDVYFIPEAKGFQKNELNFRTYIERQKSYYSSKMQLLGNSSTGRSALVSQQGLKVHLKRLFYFIFSFDFWINWSDRSVLTYLPKFLRFKMYDWIITSHYLYFSKPIISDHSKIQRG